MLVDKLPEWLIQGTINNSSFDWDKATSTTFSQLLKHITLHDSVLLHISMQATSSLLLVIQLDSFWNKAFCHYLEDWPFLLIEITDPICSFNGFTSKEDVTNIISHTETSLLSYSKLTSWLTVGKELGLLSGESYPHLKHKAIQRTEIFIIMGSPFSCMHYDSIRILLYNPQGDQLTVDLSVAPPLEQELTPKTKKPGVLSRLFHWLKAY